MRLDEKIELAWGNISDSSLSEIRALLDRLDIGVRVLRGNRVNVCYLKVGKNSLLGPNPFIASPERKGTVFAYDLTALSPEIIDCISYGKIGESKYYEIKVGNIPTLYMLESNPSNFSSEVVHNSLR
jgi:hypothetical protein